MLKKRMNFTPAELWQSKLKYCTKYLSTIFALHKDTGISRDTIYGYLKGKMPTAGNFHKICLHYKKSPDFFFRPFKCPECNTRTLNHVFCSPLCQDKFNGNDTQGNDTQGNDTPDTDTNQ